MFTLLVLSEPCLFFQHSYHFHPCSDYLAEGPSTGKNFGSARMKFGTDRLFTLQILSEPNLFFFGTRANFTRAVPKHFCSVNRALVSLYGSIWTSVVCTDITAFGLYKTSVKILPYRPPAHLIQAEYYSHLNNNY